MDSDRATRGRLLAHNTVLNVIGQGLPLLVGVAAMPVVTRGLGPARFGVLALAWALLGYVTVFDLGLGRASTKFSAEALGRGVDDVEQRSHQDAAASSRSASRARSRHGV